MSKFYEVSDATVEIFNKIYDEKCISSDIAFRFIGNEKQKQLIKLSKLSDQNVFLTGKQILVSINDELMSIFDDDDIHILIEQEIDKISVNTETGKIKMLKPDLTTFPALINKYGIEKIMKANKIEELYSQQKMDGTEEFI